MSTATTNSGSVEILVCTLRLAVIAALAITSLNATTKADQTVISFDDLTHKQGVPTNYYGLSWNNFYAYNALTGVTAAYGIPMLSAPNVAYNGWGLQASITSAVPFDFISAEMSGVFYDGMNLEVKGYCGTNFIGDQNFTLSAITPSFIQCNYYGVTSVSFISSGGTLYRTGGDKQFSMDNMVVMLHPSPPLRPLLQTVTRTNGVTTFNWAAESGQAYQIQYASDLSQGTWINLGSPVTTGTFTLTAGDACTDQQRFYRVLALP